MHPCLLVNDIIREIFLALDDERDRDDLMDNVEDAQTTFSTIRAMSGTCSVIHAVGMPFVWRELMSIFPLIKCFPEEMWEESNVEHEGKLVKCMVRLVATLSEMELIA